MPRYELSQREIPFVRQQVFPVRYKGLTIAGTMRTDLIVDERVLVELKATERTLPLHVAQVLTYLKLLPVELALLVNFNVWYLKDGIRRLTKKSSPLTLPISRSPCSLEP